MRIHPCRCTFIPPHVLDSLARVGRGNARLTIQQGKLSRTKRSVKEVSMAEFAGLAPTGEGPRKVEPRRFAAHGPRWSPARCASPAGVGQCLRMTGRRAVPQVESSILVRANGQSRP